MNITIAGTDFDYHDYDPRGDTLFLGVGGPRDALPASAYETPEGHIVEYDEPGAVVALELVNVRWALERDGEVKLTCPEEHHLARASLAAALAA
ncbi:MAG TPA: hypothetical protein VFQ14_02750 [Thermoleophilaceae bacterium]|nr:hypothetical protein [Thermoleophilaceae bacterium]